MSPASKAQQKAVNKYMSKNYDSLRITVPKGRKATVQAAADKEGESINSFTNKALLSRMGLEEWPKEDQSDEGKALNGEE